MSTDQQASIFLFHTNTLSKWLCWRATAIVCSFVWSHTTVVAPIFLHLVQNVNTNSIKMKIHRSMYRFRWSSPSFDWVQSILNLRFLHIHHKRGTDQQKAKNMSIKSRGLVFATFFVNCIVVGLLIASLATEHWIEAEAKNPNMTSATGSVHFGLFTGKKDLNVGIGPRPTRIDILATLRSEPDFMSYWLWLGTFVGTGLALLSSAIGGIASVLKSVSSRKKHGTMCLLFFSNGASCMYIYLYIFAYRTVGIDHHIICIHKYCSDTVVETMTY